MKHRLYQPLLEALIISVFILGLFYYWYGLADRYSVFLYGHTTVGIPPAQPFDPMTASRYWMCGLVASGAVMLLYSAVNWSRGRIAARRQPRFAPSTWWHVWVMASVPLAVGIPAITMTVNAPTLPPSLAAACVAVTLLGLALALLPGKWAAERPVDLMWLAADGLGLMPVLMLLRAVELPARGLSLSPAVAWLMALGSILAGVVWLTGMSLLRRRWHREIPPAETLLLSGLALSYGLLPLVHHLLATPPAYRYISAASNFFAFSPALQLVTIGVTVAMAVSATYLRRRLAR